MEIWIVGKIGFCSCYNSLDNWSIACWSWVQGFFSFVISSAPPPILESWLPFFFLISIASTSPIAHMTSTFLAGRLSNAHSWAAIKLLFGSRALVSPLFEDMWLGGSFSILKRGLTLECFHPSQWIISSFGAKTENIMPHVANRLFAFLLRIVVSQPLGWQLHCLLFYIILIFVLITTASWLCTITIYVSVMNIC